MVEEKTSDPLLLLSGTSLQVYFFLLHQKKPIGVRELQRALGFRSPSTAKHHLERLVELGLARKLGEGYVAVKPRGILANYLLLSGRFIPRTLFISVLGLTAGIVYTLLPGSDIGASVIILLLSLALLLESIKAYRDIKTLFILEEKKKKQR